MSYRSHYNHYSAKKPLLQGGAEQSFLFFFVLVAFSFILQDTLENHIHILRKGTVALLCERLDSFDDIVIKCKAYILFHYYIPFIHYLLTLDYILFYCNT